MDFYTYILYLFMLFNTILFKCFFFIFVINTFIQRGHIKRIKSDSKETYVTKDLFQINSVILNFPFKES